MELISVLPMVNPDMMSGNMEMQPKSQAVVRKVCILLLTTTSAGKHSFEAFSPAINLPVSLGCPERGNAICATQCLSSNK
jgi:hypothetical protein